MPNTPVKTKSAREIKKVVQSLDANTTAIKVVKTASAGADDRDRRDTGH